MNSTPRFPALKLRHLPACLLGALFLAGPGPVRAADFLAAAAKVDLTPPLEMKAALGGYGERLSKPAVGVHDKVWVKAVVFAQGEKRFAVVTADVLAFPPRFKAAVMERLGAEKWGADQIMLLPSHTHTSFDMMALHPGNQFANVRIGVFHKELFMHAAERIAQVVRDAAGKLSPAVAGTTTLSLADRNRNRRRGLTTHDADLTVTRVDTRDGKPLAALVNWTAHPTFMSEEDMLFSGDWPGHLQRTVEALIGSGVVAMYYNGAEGDQSPTPPADAGSRWERAERYGREIGIQAGQVWKKIEPREVKIFDCQTELIALPQSTWHPDFMKTGGTEYGLNEQMMRGFLDALQPASTRSTSLRVDDLLILGVPGEMAAELGLEVKRKARELTGAKFATIGGLADEWVSYILPAEEYRKGGYEASVSFYGETLGSVMVDGVLRSAAKLK